MEYDHAKYKVKTWKNFTYLHWIINPGLAISELLFGRRIPKVTLIDKTSDKPLMERAYVPCPHCHTIHDSRTWSGKNGTARKNWFGYYCPECGDIIPCLRNAWAWLLLALTFPLWGWFKDDLKQAWLAKQPARYKNIHIGTIKHNKVSWIKMGLRFGGFMYVFMGLYFIICYPSQYAYILLISIPACAIAGLAFALTMKFWMNIRGKKVTTG